MLELREPIDPELLRTFVAVAELRSFSAAAQFLNKTASAVSYRMKALEDQVGVALLQRTTRSVSLTPSGELLLEKASHIFDWLRGLPDELQQVRDGIETQFTLIINNLLYDAEAAALLLAQLHERFPLTVLKVRVGVYMGVWDMMLHGGGQFAIGAPGFHTISEEFLTEPLGVVNWVFVLAPGHPLASHPEPLQDDHLRPYPVVNIEDTSLRLTKRTAWRLAWQPEILVPDLPTKIACHEHGLGVGFLPAPIAREALAAHRLTERQVLSGRSQSALALAWRRKGAGRVTEHLRTLCGTRDALVAPFLRALDPPPQSRENP
jgi:LysR family transcriptional activator of the allD operon